MFFHRCSYKNSCFSELAYNSSVLVQLQIQRRCSYLKNVALDFVLLVLKLYSNQVVISPPLWMKLTMGQLLIFILCNFSGFICYVEGVPVTNLFSVIDEYISAIKKIITHEGHLRYCF